MISANQSQQNGARSNARSVLTLVKFCLPHVCGNCAKICSGFYGGEFGETLCCHCAELVPVQWSFEHHVMRELHARKMMIEIDKEGAARGF